MPVSGYALRLDLERKSFVLDSVQSLPSVEVGEMMSGGWPVVTETGSLDECKALADQIREVPGVVSLTLVYHNFEDE